ncbi:MAG: branched-chain amino acid ABC transporter permease [Bacillota bacterium]
MIYHIIVLMCIYGILAISLNLTIGFTGLFNLGHAAFFGIGAYTSALLTRAGSPVWIGLMAGALLAGLSGSFIGFSTLRLRGDYLAIATLGFGEIMRSVFRNWVGLTRGPMGLPGIPRPEILGYQFSSMPSYVALMLGFLVLTYVVIERMVNSPYGRVLKGIREDEIAVQAMGKDVVGFKLVALVVGSLFAGVAGSLYAHYITFIDPTSFTLNQTIFVLLIVVFGGLGSNAGSLVGVFILVLIRESTRFFGLPPSVSAPLQQIMFSLMLVIMMLVRPNGLLGERRLHLKPKTAKGMGSEHAQDN